MIFSTASSASPTRHWKIAECSESIGSISTRFSWANLVIRSPATTSVSLLARAICFPAFTARKVGSKPEKPTMAVTTVSIEPISTTCAMASHPAYTLIGSWARASRTCSYLASLLMITTFGKNLRACSISNSALLLAVSTSTAKRSGLCSMISRVC